MVEQPAAVAVPHRPGGHIDQGNRGGGESRRRLAFGGRVVMFQAYARAPELLKIELKNGIHHSVKAIISGEANVKPRTIG